MFVILIASYSGFVGIRACFDTGLFACLLVCLLVCLLACLLAGLCQGFLGFDLVLVFKLVCLLAFAPACVPHVCMPVWFLCVRTCRFGH